MIAYILDTDSLSLYQRGQAILAARIAHARPAIALTVISIEEQIRGWYTLLRRVKRDDHLEAAYQGLADSVTSWHDFPLVRFTSTAIARYRTLLAAKINIGKMDLRIAAIALESVAIVVTRNKRDFSRVPGITVEDWSA